MLSKKHYIKIAGILKKNLELADPCEYDREVVNNIASDITIYFKQDNPAFSISKFNMAIYGEFK